MKGESRFNTRLKGESRLSSLRCLAAYPFMATVSGDYPEDKSSLGPVKSLLCFQERYYIPEAKEEVTLPSRIKPRLSFQSRLKPKLTFQSRIKPRLSFQSRLKPKLTFQSRVKPRLSFQSRLKPKLTFQSRVKPRLFFKSRIKNLDLLYSKNFPQANQQIRLQYSNQIKLLDMKLFILTI
jgi:hypothetical protein